MTEEYKEYKLWLRDLRTHVSWIQNDVESIRKMLNRLRLDVEELEKSLEVSGNGLKEKKSEPCPCDDCWNNFHNNEWCPCDQNLMSPHCKTLEDWKKRQKEKGVSGVSKEKELEK